MAEAGAAPASGGEGEARTPDGSEDLARLRAALLRAYPETVEELVAGQSVDDLLASLDRAGAAFRRIAERVGAGEAATTTATAAPAVPAGDVRPLAIDPDALPTVEKIRLGLAGRA